MATILNATEVRRNFSRFIDDVLRERPTVVVRRRRDAIAAISLEGLAEVLRRYRFTLEYEQEEDGSYSGSVQEIDVIANAPTLDELKWVLAQDLIEYAKQYETEYPLYSKALNRRSHLPYILHVLLQENPGGVVELIDA